jgi:hypothetical protein
MVISTRGGPILAPLLNGRPLSLDRIRQLAKDVLPAQEVDRLLSRAVREGLLTFDRP